MFVTPLNISPECVQCLAALAAAGSHSVTDTAASDDPTGHSGGLAVPCLSLGPLGLYAHLLCFVASPSLKLLRLFSKNHQQHPDDPAFSFPSKTHHLPCALPNLMFSEFLPAAFISI